MKTEEEIKSEAVRRYGDRLAELDGFREGATWIQDQYNWIDVNIRQPEIYQGVNFVVVSSNLHYNGKVYGGTYQGNKFGYHEFACPGIGFCGTHWQPLPEPPKNK